jgi:hypothetical protein
VLIGQREHAAARRAGATHDVNENVESAETLQYLIDDFVRPLARADIAWTNNSTARPSGKGERAVVATVAPPRTRRSTIASPMPSVPPVTKVRLPANSAGSNENRQAEPITRSRGARSSRHSG